MRNLSATLNLGFLYACRGLLYRMDKKCEHFTVFDIKSCLAISSRTLGGNELSQFENVLFVQYPI